MVQSLTAAQTTALALESQEVVVAVKIDLASDLLYCTGIQQVTLDGDTYTPRGLQAGVVNVAGPKTSSATVTIDDLDGEVAAVWYTGRFSGQTVTITEAIWSNGSWEIVRTVPWICTTCDRRSDGTFIIHLSGAGGLKPRAGLEVASRADWHLAPEPGTSIQVGFTATVVG
jgi:hypothetical protein